MTKSLSPRAAEAQRQFGERLASLRGEAGLSQAALARMVGTDANRISRFERGLISPSLGTIVRLADALGVEPEALFRW